MVNKSLQFVFSSQLSTALKCKINSGSGFSSACSYWPISAHVTDLMRKNMKNSGSSFNAKRIVRFMLTYGSRDLMLCAIGALLWL